MYENIEKGLDEEVVNQMPEMNVLETALLANQSLFYIRGKVNKIHDWTPIDRF